MSSPDASSRQSWRVGGGRDAGFLMSRAKGSPCRSRRGGLKRSACIAGCAEDVSSETRHFIY
eukprot:2124988-Pyramimonas_sp.AAC.1